MDWQEISVDDIRKNRPDLLQEIIDDVLVSSFAGRSDEVYNIVLPAINEMRAEIETVTKQLKYDLEAIVEKQAKKKFANLLQEIDRTTKCWMDWRSAERKKICSEVLRKMQFSSVEETRDYLIKESTGQKTPVHPRPSGNKPSLPKAVEDENQSIAVGDEIEYQGGIYTVFRIRKKYGIRELTIMDKNGHYQTIRLK